MKNSEAIIPSSAEKEYLSVSPTLLNSNSKDIFILTADGGNHFTDYGIFEGTRVFFDGELPFAAGKLSAFVNNADPKKPKFKMSLSEEKGFSYVGRAIARMNYFES